LDTFTLSATGPNQHDLNANSLEKIACPADVAYLVVGMFSSSLNGIYVLSIPVPQAWLAVLNFAASFSILESTLECH
jgi:hypothetical protein